MCLCDDGSGHLPSPRAWPWSVIFIRQHLTGRPSSQSHADGPGPWWSNTCLHQHIGSNFIIFSCLAGHKLNLSGWLYSPGVQPYRVQIVFSTLRYYHTFLLPDIECRESCTMTLYGMHILSHSINIGPGGWTVIAENTSETPSDMPHKIELY